MKSIKCPEDSEEIAQEHQCFIESVMEGIADADAGRVMDVETLRKRLAARKKAHPSHEDIIRHG